MKSNFQDIVDFHEKFRLITSPGPAMLTDDLFEFRHRFLMEEIAELVEAHASGDLVKTADALVDIVYVALGTAYLMGIPWQAIWTAVHNANMTKIRADENNPSKRNAPAFDIVKPEGWVSPEDHIRHILLNWRNFE